MKNITFNKIENLRLSGNKIEDINIFQSSVFSQLKELYLSNNKIKDINIFENSKFNQLESLALNNNEISDISVLEKVKFIIFLRELNIKNNKLNLEKNKYLLNNFSHIKYLYY